MRTLQLGVLIVCGGTLAALPFRRYQVLKQASTDPFEVTGPEQSDLLAFGFETSNLRADVVRADPAATDADRGFVHSVEKPWVSSGGDYSTVPRTGIRKSLDIPLTFEDLAAPIERPGAIQDRFVTATPEDEVLTSPDAVLHDGPLAVTQDFGRSPGPKQPVASSLTETNLGQRVPVNNRSLVDSWKPSFPSDQSIPKDQIVTGRFASMTDTEPDPDRAIAAEWVQGNQTNPRKHAQWRALPDVTESTRDRHWIQQPR